MVGAPPPTHDAARHPVFGCAAGGTMWRSRRGHGAGCAAGQGVVQRTGLSGGGQSAVESASPAEAADAPACGWFESSRLLREGVSVHEHEVLDPIVNELPVAWWIEWAGLSGRGRRP